MSSSNQSITSKRYFLAVVFLSLCGTLILLFSAWIIDPLGILQEHRGFPSLCANGVKVDPDDSVSRLLPLTTESVVDVIIGTSRIKKGITQEAWRSVVSKSGTNLFLSKATIGDLHNILLPLIRRKNPSRIWIGINYGMFVTPTTSRIHSLPAYEQQNRYSIYRHGVFSTQAMNAATKVLLSGVGCNRIERDSSGFVTREVKRHTTEADIARHAVLSEQLFSSNEFHNGERYQDSLERFSEILETANINGVSMNIFINPSHPKYLHALNNAGHSEKYIHWKNSISNTVNALNQNGLDVQFIDFTHMIEEENITCDPFSLCPFYDLIHFHPSIGKRMLSQFKDS
ncbi:Uncharacterised protein [BD1-7 clade bacterium]|uniref:Uncharacterized protein n=1 Tax=BD1-7 clade bacterium TaxID=2029982 RepID=A0A5S9PXJ2_9GAMM|nr:Uncharacterised protein [BD1-7 clade bacterium]CAA0113099.1 Uncharacterised protein [BD1-7 clade bacterium]